MGRENLSGEGYDLNKEEMIKLKEMQDEARRFKDKQDAERLAQLRESYAELTSHLGDNISPKDVLKFQSMKDAEENRKKELRKELEKEAV